MSKIPSTSRSGHQFSQVPKAEILRSSFDRSSGYKTSFNAGKLVPFFVDEALPGDTFNLRTAGFARLSTPIYPVMDNMFLDTFYFAVPNRLLWDNWEKFMGEQTNPGDSTDFLIPQINMTNGIAEGTLGDYMGIPTKVNNLGVSALPFRAYNLIYNEWFRDENLQDSVTITTADGPDDPIIYGLWNRGKRHDYFTSCLPWPQKGPDVALPLGTTAPVIRVATSSPDADFNMGVVSKKITSQTISGSLGVIQDATNPSPDATQLSLRAANFQADLTNATASTINALRLSFQVQKLYERDARGGTRYTELVKAHFNVTSPDSRLQRPEYLGGGSTPININPIHASAGSSGPDQDPATGLRDLGSLSAIGTASFNGHGFTKSFTEHCTIIGMLNVRADLSYQQGLNRMWSRKSRFDFYWPALAQVGEQSVLQQEIMATGVQEEDELVFGYQERFAEMRYKPSLITGAMRSNAGQPLDAWHLAQNFASAPKLNADFIIENPPVSRVVATPAEPQFIADFYHKLTCARPMPLYGVPGNMDRF